MKLKKFFLLFIGIFSLALSFVFLYLPLNTLNSFLCNMFFLTGNILIFDSISKIITRFSVFNFFGSIWSIVLKLLILTFIFVGLFEFYGLNIFHYWYFPYWDFSFFWYVFIPFGLAYALYFICLYLGTKAVFLFIFKKNLKIKNNLPKFRFSWTVGVISLIGFLLGGTLVFLENYKLASITIINSPIKSTVPAIYCFILFSLLVVFFETLEQKIQKTSLLLETMRGNIYPLVVIVLSSWIIGTPYEFFNVKAWFWIYTNVPFGEIMIYHVPLIVLVFWPLQGLMALYPYRILFKNESKDLWNF